MTSLILLAACALIPWIACATLRALLTLEGSSPPAMRERALWHYRRATLFTAIVVLPASAVAGALVVDPALSTPMADNGFVVLCEPERYDDLGQPRIGPTHAPKKPPRCHVSKPPAAPCKCRPLRSWPRGCVCLRAPRSKLCFRSGQSPRLLSPLRFFRSLRVIVVSPWLVIKLGVWPMFPRRIEADGVSWRLAHLPAPTPFLTHTAALPWLRTARGERRPLQQGTRASTGERWCGTRWGGALSSRVERRRPIGSVAIPLSVIVFIGVWGCRRGRPPQARGGNCIGGVLHGFGKLVRQSTTSIESRVGLGRPIDAGARANASQPATMPRSGTAAHFTQTCRICAVRQAVCARPRPRKKAAYMRAMTLRAAVLVLCVRPRLDRVQERQRVGRNDANGGPDPRRQAPRCRPADELSVEPHHRP